MKNEELATVPLIVHDAECSRYCKYIFALTLLAAMEAIAFGAFALTLAIR